MVVTLFPNSQSPVPSRRSDPDPGDVEILAREAERFTAEGRAGAALRDYQLALLMDESRADLWFQYGNLQERCGQIADAIESFEFALRQQPTMVAARYRLACAYFESGRPLEALSQFRLVTRQRPAHLPAWRYVVQITWALGNLAEAEEYAREALAHAPDTELASMLERIAKDRAA